jgi:hypothetical protein
MPIIPGSGTDMANEDTDPTRPRAVPETVRSRQERQAAALRENLRKRKAQARGRDRVGDAADADDPADRTDTSPSKPASSNE